jgi:hypothetical protein
MVAPNECMNIENYLRQEGLKPFTDEKRFWRWANNRIGSQATKRFLDLMSQRSTGSLIGDAGLYDFLADPKTSVVSGCFEYGLLVEILKWVEPQLPQEGTIVELGCHTGLLTRFYALARPQAQVIGIDISRQAIETAGQLAQERAINNLAYLIADLRHPDPLPEIKADCVISGRVLSELMTPKRRRRASWKDYEYPNREAPLDRSAEAALAGWSRFMIPEGKLLVTERLGDFDRLNRLWSLVQNAGYRTDLSQVTPVIWQDVAGEHRTWFFGASWPDVEENGPSTTLLPPFVPMIHREAEAGENATRLMLEGLLAWQTWQSLDIRQRGMEGLLRWPAGEEIHYELGMTRGELGYAYVASNTDIHLLTLCLPGELAAVRRDLEEYIRQLQSSGARPSAE